MTFHKAKFHNHGSMKFKSCMECPHKFEEGEQIWKRSIYNSSGSKVVGYLCKKCHGEKYLDL